MNFAESQQILEKINSAQNIILNLHHNPDADSIGSAVAFGHFLQKKNKPFKIITPTPVLKNFEFLFDEFKYQLVYFKNFDFRNFDLFIANDSSSWTRVSGGKNIPKPQIFFISIDHHKTNQAFADINLTAPDASSNSLVVYKIFRDLGIDIDQRMSRALLAGIYGDTGVLRYPEADLETYQVAVELLKLADKDEIIFNLYNSFDYSHVQVWKEIMHNLEIDQDHQFVFSFIDKSVMEKNNNPINAKAEIADFIFQSIEGTKFGMVGSEAEGYVSVSFRAREDVDVSILASRLGGGGHKWASAARVWEGDFKLSIERILEEARKFAKENV